VSAGKCVQFCNASGPGEAKESRQEATKYNPADRRKNNSDPLSLIKYADSRWMRGF